MCISSEVNFVINFVNLLWKMYIKNAALVLKPVSVIGYTKKIYDNDGKAPTSSSLVKKNGFVSEISKIGKNPNQGTLIVRQPLKNISDPSLT